MPARMAQALMLVFGVLAVILTGLSGFRLDFVFAACGAWAGVLMLVPPSVVRGFQLVSGWSFVGLTVSLGVVLRGFYLSASPRTERLEALFFRGRTPDEFVIPAILLLFGLGMMVAGYLSLVPREKVRSPVRIHRPTLYWIAAAIFSISFAATVLYIDRTGGFDLSRLSAKRTAIPGLDLAGKSFQSHGELRFLGSLAIFACLLIVADALEAPRRRKWLMAVALLLVAIAIPFFSSVRTTVAMYLLFPVVLIALNRPRLSSVWLMGSGTAVLALMILMTLLRPGSGGALDAIVLNRNQIDLPKTAHLYHAVPNDLPRAHGRTIARWAAAPIPRFLWTDKPVIPPGPYVGNAIYDQKRAGVPPSMMGEWYWNFGWPGVVIGSFLFGALLRWLDERFRPVAGDPFRAALYVAGPLFLGYEAVGSSIGGGIYQSLFRWAILGAILILIRQTPVSSSK